MDNLNFRISSALKNIIWKELITNKFVAIFELVKNSYDAAAERVDIIFENNKIIIKDNGKWMSLDDIKNKWLFVWYSAKADNTENKNYKNFRNKISTRKKFAWAKGIWRFACDRLWSNLKLITKKDEENSKIESINVLWDSFELDSKEEFVNINVKHETLKDDFWLDHGTVLEIINFREEWTEKDIEDLNRYLWRLINPNENEDDNFEIYITLNWKEKKIENFVFEKLNIKTTKLIIDISKNFITSELIDRWEMIYKIVEENPWKDTLYDIKVVLYYLNKASKLEFHRIMSMITADYGSISLYKNWFRIFPFWEPWVDLFWIDQRKNQWYARYLWTRDLLWKIEINNESPDFKESTSRDKWLIETQSYFDLKEFFIDICIKRLEAYVVETLDWTFKEEKKEDWKIISLAQEFFPEDRKENISQLLNKLTKSKWYITTEYWYNFEEKVKEKAEKWFIWATAELKKEAIKTWNKVLENAVNKIEKTYERNEEKLKNSNEKVEKLEQQNASLKVFINSPLFKNIADYHHDISITTGNIKNYLDSTIKLLRENKIDEAEISIINALMENEKINSITKIATKSWLEDWVHKKKMPLVQKIMDYTNEYLSYLSNIKVKYVNNRDSDYIIDFRYFDLVTILDNITNNSIKNWAKNLKIDIWWTKDYLEINFIDDWKWLNEKFQNNPDEIFEPRISTTNWSGWGLTQIRDIIKQMKWTISVEPQKSWIIFKIIFLSWK